jgi:hypothetical protein
MNSSIPAALARCAPSARAAIVASLSPPQVRLLNRYFPEWAHAGQLEPPGDGLGGAGALGAPWRGRLP